MINLNKLNLIIIFLFLSNCVATSQKTKIQINEQKSKIEENEVKDSKVELIDKMPNWCQNPKISIVAIQVCGIAESSNLQTSRTRSELDGRKQIARRFNAKITENLKEADQNLNTNTESVTKFNVQKSTIIKRKTVFINNKYITYTLIVYPL
tara:strand:+ start:79 stop:534 length:456 start_codon:yes stop_codon:yes gene_type:complete